MAVRFCGLTPCFATVAAGACLRSGDESRNISPVVVWIRLDGEELHDNHHADPRSAKSKARWFEEGPRGGERVRPSDCQMLVRGQ